MISKRGRKGFGSVGVVDLAEGVALAVELAKELHQPPVICGGLALATYGYMRSTTDVDLVLPLIFGAAGEVEAAAARLGLSVKARHSFGGLDLRAGNARIDVLTLERDFPGFLVDAIEEAVASDRRTEVFGQQVYVISLGHLITMKLIAEREKDKGDIVELIKAQIAHGAWSAYEAKKTVKRWLPGAEYLVDRYEGVARRELGT